MFANESAKVLIQLLNLSRKELLELSQMNRQNQKIEGKKLAWFNSTSGSIGREVFQKKIYLYL